MAERDPHPALAADVVLAPMIGAYACRGGCPVVTFADAAGRVFAEAHLIPENVEPFIALLRAVAAEAAARRRPLA